MKFFTLSKRTVPANGTTVGTVQETSTDAPVYALKNKNPPANYPAGFSGSPTVYLQAVENIALLRRQRVVKLLIF